MFDCVHKSHRSFNYTRINRNALVLSLECAIIPRQKDDWIVYSKLISNFNNTYKLHSVNIYNDVRILNLKGNDKLQIRLVRKNI